ncbi:uncharacterized protein LOC121934473 [Sceloporus undulatus]|uniref:uncharacterized protein LOC121934473 n=1 Tax=Sceloporus undulatus TaxID=8520 RepID=UPI001C4D9045|nr:uncharacterized protein LOC121934473 [Sceloporus undulatus]
MREILCFCLILSFLWEQMVNAYKYMSGIFLVTHPSKQRASDCSRQPTKMDVSILEEQYDCLKQKQKQQTHIIVFKTDKNESMPKESMVNPVLINKNTIKAKVFKEHASIKEVCLELPHNGNIEDSSPWRIHLELHRLEQGEHQKVPCDVMQNKNEQIGNDSKLLSQKKSMVSCEESLKCSEESIKLLSEQKNLSPAEKRDSSDSSFAPVKWTYSQMSVSKLASASNKLPYYPFPQKKNSQDF